MVKWDQWNGLKHGVPLVPQQGTNTIFPLTPILLLNMNFYLYTCIEGLFDLSLLYLTNKTYLCKCTEYQNNLILTLLLYVMIVD